MNKNKIVAIIQARCNSTRFPNKILKKIGNLSLIEILLKRISLSKKIDEIVVSTTRSKNDDYLIKILKKNKIAFYRGDENNVLKRYYNTAKKFNAKIIVRITADCPLIDPKIVDQVISLFISKKVSFASNIEPPTYPDGLDVEVFSFKELEKANKFAKSKFDKEHVTPYIKYNKKIKKANKFFKSNFSHLRITVDEEADLKLLKKLLKKTKNIIKFDLQNIIKIYESDKSIFDINGHISRNDGGFLNKGQKLWKRALNIIPDGNMLLSKRPDFYLPKLWPVYFSKAKGVEVWDLENKKYTDMSVMGVGTNILGYANKVINRDVQLSLDKSNMSTLNCPEEVKLAEKLIELHPWFDMVKFAKTGGEANAIAIRIARAKAGRDKVAVCGYHGWHDWYLSANLNDKKNLDTHLLKDLSTNGIPKKLKNTVFPFEYNNYEQLKKICKNNDIGVIKMEVFRNFAPSNNFLKKVKNLANKKNIVLIFDECTSGFRETLGGLHKKYKIEPDICILGKALGNGYPITAVIGKKEVMKHASSSLISSTFWTDRIGFIAALKTLSEMERKKSWKMISQIGGLIKKKWKMIAKKNKLKIKISGLSACPSFYIPSSNWLKYKTLITQYMLEKNYLATNTVYVSTEHKNKKILNKYFTFLDEVFKKIKNCENKIDNIDSLLKTDTCQSTFKRLN